MSTFKVLLTGANGQFGRCFQDRAEGFELITACRDELDISDLSLVESFIRKVQPHAVVNAAAFTAVDKAESEKKRAHSVNAAGPEYLAKACERLQIPLIHISTDYVFDGKAKTPYRPSSPTSPLGIYGKSKLKGEHSVAAHCSRYMIIRTAWVFSEYGGNFVKTMLKLGSERPELSVVCDQIGGPTYAGHLAEVCIELLTKYRQEPNSMEWGVYHFCGDKPVSWYDFSEVIFKQAAELGLLKKLPDLKPIYTSEYPTAAERPAYSVLGCESLLELLNKPVNRDWQQALSEVLPKI